MGVLFVVTVALLGGPRQRHRAPATRGPAVRVVRRNQPDPLWAEPGSGGYRAHQRVTERRALLGLRVLQPVELRIRPCLKLA